MNATRRAVLASAGLLATPAFAQDTWPNRTIRIIVPYPPGGGSDVTARLIAPGMQAALGQTVVIDNRPGATGIIGTEAAARSPADGYTLLLADMPHTITPALNRNLPYDLVADFAPVSILGVAPMALFANASVPASNAAEFAALARARPEGFSYASAGIAGNTHLMAELFQRIMGIRLVHVPYRGSGPAIQDVAAGQVPVMFTTMLTAAPGLQNNSIKGLGVASASRLPDLPNTPTFREQGIDLVAEHWWGLLAPARTPEPIVARLAASVASAMAQPDLRPRIAQIGLIPRAEGPAHFAAQIRADLDRWATVVREANIRLE
jgi:tripartite-type tricarboxylate transporter receptor subunit TctC